MRRRQVLAGALSLPLLTASAPDEAVAALLSHRITAAHDSLGYVAAVIDAAGTRIIPVGRSGNDRALDGDSVFEIGSVTKVFTALLLADMVLSGEVAFADPVAKYLPPEGRPQDFDGKPMTLLDLATYTSGLPRLPGNMAPKDPANPFADYTVAQLYQAVSGFTPRFYPGSHYEYTNFGFGLLGHVLALRADMPFEALVIQRICQPLGLEDTRITLSPDQLARLVPGHDEARVVANWDIPTLPGAGALRATANDLIRFLDASQGRRVTPLAPAFRLLLDVRRQTDTANTTVAAGWFLTNDRADELVWKDGGTGGYCTFIGASTRTGRAAVLLSNTDSYLTTPEIGMHLINKAFPLPGLRQFLPLDQAKLDRLAGRYAIAPGFVLTVTPRDGHLMVQATGQTEYEVFPLSELRFAYRVVEAELSFTLGADGLAAAAVLHQNSRNLRGPRLP